jgi:hypothetical protein
MLQIYYMHILLSTFLFRFLYEVSFLLHDIKINSLNFSCYYVHHVI